MVTHVVLFKWKEGTDPKAIAQVKQELQALRGKIPGIVDVRLGDNFSARAQGFHFGVVMRFTDRASLDAYGPHPAHQRVVQEVLTPIMADVLAVDYES